MLSLYLHPSTVWDRLLVILIVATVILFFMMIGLMCTALFLRYRNSKKAERWQRLEETWAPLLLDALTGSLRLEEVQKRVLPKDSLYFIDYLLRYARRLGGKESQTLHRLAVPNLKYVVRELKHKKETRRARAAFALGVLDFETYRNELIACLDDPSPLVAIVVVRALVRPENADVMGAIAERLDRFRNWRPNFLVNLLTRVGRDAIVPLRERLVEGKSRSEWEETILVKALTLLGDLDITSYCVKRLPTAQTPELQTALLQLLGKVGGPTLAASVIPFCDAPNLRVRMWALTTLGEVGGPDNLSFLRQKLDDPSNWVALHAARALFRMGDLNTLQDLAQSQHPRAVLALEVLGKSQ